MNYLTYQFSITENEGTRNIQTLNAEVSINTEPEDETEQKYNLDIWYDHPDEKGEWGGKPESDSFGENAAIALRDFLIFCFPLCKK